MFATVEFYEREKGIKAAVKDFLFQPKIITEKIPLPENEYFYKLKVPVTKGRIPLQKLKRISDITVDGLIFPSGFLCDDESIRIFAPGYFRELLIFNTAVSMIKKEMEGPVGTVTLIDKKGVLTSEAERLVPLASEIRIISDNINPYRIVAEKIMEKYGLSLLVTDRLSAIASQGIIISAESACVPLSFRGIVITEEKRCLPFARVLTGENIKAKKEYTELCPKNTDIKIFLAALCEVCYVRELRQAEYEKLVDIC